MQKFRTILIVAFFLSLSSLLFGATFGEPVVLYLHAYIPERTTFIATDESTRQGGYTNQRQKFLQH